MCYSPVCHCTLAGTVRLACIMHAASVYPEPGSNSLSKKLKKFVALSSTEKRGSSVGILSLRSCPLHGAGGRRSNRERVPG